MLVYSCSAFVNAAAYERVATMRRPDNRPLKVVIRERLCSVVQFWD